MFARKTLDYVNIWIVPVHVLEDTCC